MSNSRNRQQTEASLIKAATQAFADKGYEAATTRSIADAAGCSEALIQRYFNGKEGLLAAIIRDEGANQKYPDLVGRPLCASLNEEAKYILTKSVAVFTKKADVMNILISRVLIDPSFRDYFNEVAMRGPVKKAIILRLEAYVAAGMIEKGTDLDSAAELLMSLNLQLGFVHHQIFQSEPKRINKLITEFAKMFDRALSAKHQD
jgi:TetR/AcrR family transcriptional regulator, regulator of cefoperazone and chloramphenicol sensitivity